MVGNKRPPPSSSLELKQEVNVKARVPVMAGVKAGECVGSVTRAFKEKVEQDTEEELQAFRSFKRKLLEDKAKKIEAEFEKALKEVDEDHKGLMYAIRHQEKLLAEETAKKERDKHE